jgi:hypothetical protein
MIRRILVVATSLALVAAVLALWAGETLAPPAASANTRPLAIAELLARAREDVRKPERKSLATILLPRSARTPDRIERETAAPVKFQGRADVKGPLAPPAPPPSAVAEPASEAGESAAPSHFSLPQAQAEAPTAADIEPPILPDVPLVEAAPLPVAPTSFESAAAISLVRSIGAARDNVPNAFGLNPAVDVEQLSEAMARRAFAAPPAPPDKRSGLASLSGEVQPPAPLSGTVSAGGTGTNEAGDSQNTHVEQQDQVTAFQTAAADGGQP